MNIFHLHAPLETKNALQSFFAISHRVNRLRARKQLASDSKLDRLSARAKLRPFSSTIVAGFLFLMLSFFIWLPVYGLVPAHYRPAADTIPAIGAVIGTIVWLCIGLRSPPFDFKAEAFKHFLIHYHNGDLAAAKVCLNNSELLYKNVRAVWGAVYLSAVATLMAHAKVWTVFFSYAVSKPVGYNFTDILAASMIVILLVWYESTIGTPAAWIEALLVASRNHELKQGPKERAHKV